MSEPIPVDAFFQVKKTISENGEALKALRERIKNLGLSAAPTRIEPAVADTAKATASAKGT